MVDSDWLRAELLKTSWLDRMIFVSAGLTNRSIVIFFHFKINWLRNSYNCFNYLLISFGATDLFSSKTLGHSKSPIFSFFSFRDAVIEQKRKSACPEYAREYTYLHASRHRKNCGVLKCSNCNFYTYSSEELTNHNKKKHDSCQHNVK